MSKIRISICRVWIRTQWWMCTHTHFDVWLGIYIQNETHVCDEGVYIHIQRVCVHWWMCIHSNSTCVKNEYTYTFYVRIHIYLCTYSFNVCDDCVYIRTQRVWWKCIHTHAKCVELCIYHPCMYTRSIAVDLWILNIHTPRVCMFKTILYTKWSTEIDLVYTARTASWNNRGVESVNQEGPGC